MQQLKPSIDLKKDKEQKPEKGRKRKFSGRQGCFMKMGECWVYDEPLLKRLGAAKH